MENVNNSQTQQTAIAPSLDFTLIPKDLVWPKEASEVVISAKDWVNERKIIKLDQYGEKIVA